MIWMIWHKHRKHSTADKKGSFSLYLHAIGIKKPMAFFIKIFFLESKWLFFKSNNYKKKRRYFMDALITEAKKWR